MVVHTYNDEPTYGANMRAPTSSTIITVLPHTAVISSYLYRTKKLFIRSVYKKRAQTDSIFLGGGGDYRLKPLPLIRFLKSKLSENSTSLHRTSRQSVSQITRELKLILFPPNKNDPFGPSLLGGGGEIRTPAPDLSRLTI